MIMGWFTKKKQSPEQEFFPVVPVAIEDREPAKKAVEAPKKYRILEEKETVHNQYGGFTGYRIQALVDIPLHGVTAGDLGGFVAHQSVLSHEGSCWIGGDAFVGNALNTRYSGYSYSESPKFNVEGDALVTGKAYVCGQVWGNAQISGSSYVSAEVGNDSVITDNAYIFASSVRGSVVLSGNVRVTNVYIMSRGKKPVTISGDITLNGKSDKNRIFCGDNDIISLSGTSVMNNVSIEGSLVFDADVNLEEVSFNGNTTILGKPQIKPQVKFTGRNVISGDSLIPPGSHVHDVTMDSGVLHYGSPQTASMSALEQGNVSKGETPALVAMPAVSIDITEYIDTIEQIEAEYEAYTTDIVKLIKFPAMADASIPEVADFVSKLRSAKRAVKSGGAEKLRNLAEGLENAFVRAESKVTTLVASHLDEGKKKSLKDAEKMFKLACDEASPEPEKRLGFKAGMRALEGIVPVSEKASDNMKARIGILELEA
jgi:hypothetical protein